jgi:hypothetical protein
MDGFVSLTFVNGPTSIMMRMWLMTGATGYNSGSYGRKKLSKLRGIIYPVG